jgi:hypothetical protein
MPRYAEDPVFNQYLGYIKCLPKQTSTLENIRTSHESNPITISA